jgi:hypothetical protein
MVHVECVECRKRYNTIIGLIEHFQKEHPVEFEALLHYILDKRDEE